MCVMIKGLKLGAETIESNTLKEIIKKNKKKYEQNDRARNERGLFLQKKQEWPLPFLSASV